jgi:hypothetical protein
MQPYGKLQTRVAVPRGRSHLDEIFQPLGAQWRGARSMRKETKPSPTESPWLFEVDPQPFEETLTALGETLEWSKPSALWGCCRG